MSFWTKLLQGAGKAAKGVGTATKATGKAVGGSVLHPQQTLRGAGTAMKTAAVGSAAGYVAWEKIVNDKSVLETTTDIVVGKDAKEKVSEAVDSVAELKDKAGEAVDSVNNAMSDINSKWSGMSNFFSNIFSGNAVDMFGSFFGNLAKGKVSGFSLVGLVAAAFLTFGRFGWLGKIAGAMLGMMLIGNNTNVSQSMAGSGNNGKSLAKAEDQSESETQSRGMHR
jgi:tetrahydromethanopterin S-methyltransferase subunit B